MSLTAPASDLSERLRLLGLDLKKPFWKGSDKRLAAIRTVCPEAQGLKSNVFKTVVKNY